MAGDVDGGVRHLVLVHGRDAARAMVEPEVRPLGSVDKPDSQTLFSVIQDCFLEGGGVGTLSDERRGMGGV